MDRVDCSPLDPVASASIMFKIDALEVLLFTAFPLFARHPNYAKILACPYQFCHANTGSAMPTPVLSCRHRFRHDTK